MLLLEAIQHDPALDVVGGDGEEAAHRLLGRIKVAAFLEEDVSQEQARRRRLLCAGNGLGQHLLGGGEVLGAPGGPGRAPGPPR